MRWSYTARLCVDEGRNLYFTKSMSARKKGERRRIGKRNRKFEISNFRGDGRFLPRPFRVGLTSPAPTAIENVRGEYSLNSRRIGIPAPVSAEASETASESRKDKRQGS